jgi:hypothetical protein
MHTCINALQHIVCSCYAHMQYTLLECMSPGRPVWASPGSVYSNILLMQQNACISSVCIHVVVHVTH